MNRPTAVWSVSAALVIVAGAWLRLHGLTHMEFTRDEQDALVLASVPAQVAGRLGYRWAIRD